MEGRGDPIVIGPRYAGKAVGLGTHTVEKFSACSQAVTSSGLELSRSIGA